MTKKMTRWFKPPEKPVRKGVYQIRSLYSNKIFSYWTGSKWLWSYDTPHAAAHAVAHEKWNTEWQDKSWRGFTEKQK